MTKYFGTDGIRGRANDTLTNEIAYKVGFFLGNYAKSNKMGKICIGKDTRISSSMLECSLASGIAASGCNAYLIGYCSTPCLAYVSQYDEFDFGIMISASHNPYYDNGIKVFSNNGLKIPEELENKIEEYIDKPEGIEVASKENIGYIYEYKEGLQHYIKWLENLYPTKFYNYNVLVDCSNGSNSYIAHQVLSDLECKHTMINANPNGININRDCGSTHLETLQKEIKKDKYDFGFAFDGDADRVLFVTGDGEVVDGDVIMYILATYLKSRNKLKNNTLVTTVMSNIGLHKALDAKGISTVITPVGDKSVLDEMIKNNYSVGGEQSGHIILLDDSRFGDGLKTALAVFKVLIDNDIKLSDIKNQVRIYPQKLENIIVKDKNVVLNDSDINNCIDKIEQKLKNNGRILVRPSGTEPLIRVMVEAPNDKACDTFVSEVIELIKKKGYQK